MVSICIPTYEMGGRGVEMLDQLLDSIRMQSFRDYEIVISDHSKGEDIRNHVLQWDDIVYVRNELFRGSSSYNMNNAIRHATGKYIKPMFQDDLFDNTRSLEYMVKAMDRAHWVAGRCRHCEDDPNFRFRMHTPHWDGVQDLRQGINRIGSPSCIMYERGDVWFDNNLIWLMDCDFYISLYKKYGIPRLLEDDTCVVSRQWPGSVSNSIATDKIKATEASYMARKVSRPYKIAVVTALAGIRDEIVDPAVVHPGVDYHAWSDLDWHCKVWKQHPMDGFSIDQNYRGRRNAKIYKIMPHLFLPDYDVHIWIDPTHEVREDPYEIIGRYMTDKQDVGAFRHRERICAYSEAAEVLKLGYDSPKNIEAATTFMSEDGYPSWHGLYEIPVLIRRNTPSVGAMNLMWWELICRTSSRDQITFPYVVWKNNINVATLPGYANGINPATGTVGYNDLIPQVRRHK